MSKKNVFRLFLAVSLAFLADCDQELTSSLDQPKVNYVLVVTDSATTAALPGVKVRLTTLAGDTATYYTDAQEGRLTIPTLYSSRTIFLLEKPGYKALDVIDTVSDPRDTVFNRPINRLLRLKMVQSNFGQVGPGYLLKDTVSTGDTLVFKFNQPVAKIERVTVRLTNFSRSLWLDVSQDNSRNILRVVQKDGDWQAGKRYDYELVLRDALGNVFRAPNDSAPMLRGSFFVRQKSSQDSSLVFPKNFRLAFFNSGNFLRFDSLNLETSPLPDSTTRFARLKWAWPTGKRVDSIMILIKDDGIAAPDWSVLTTFPGSLDSATLDFADMYSTHNGVSQHPVFPLLTSANAQIHVRLVAKEGATFPQDFDTTLATIRQGMGPSLYAYYAPTHRLKDSVDAKDSIDVRFLKNPNDSTDFFEFPDSFTSPLLMPVSNAKLDWKWIPSSSGRTTLGRIYYAFSGTPGNLVRFQADFTGILLDGKPIWMRNRTQGQPL